MAVMRDNPYGAYNFLVALGGADPNAPAAGFEEVTGLGLEIEYVEYRNGNDKRNTVRKITGLNKATDVTLKRGVIGSTDLYDWIKAVADGNIARQDVVITLLDEARNPVMTWILRGALPKKWTGPSLNAKSSEVAMEDLTITAESIDLE